MNYFNSLARSMARWLARQMQNATVPSGLCSPSAFVCTFFGNRRHLLPRRVRVRVLHPSMRMGYALGTTFTRLPPDWRLIFRPRKSTRSPFLALVLVLLLNFPNEGKASLGESFDRRKGRNPGPRRRKNAFIGVLRYLAV